MIISDEAMSAFNYELSLWGMIRIEGNKCQIVRIEKPGDSSSYHAIGEPGFGGDDYEILRKSLALRAALEAALAAIPLDAVTRDRCAEAVDVILHHAKATGIESGFNCGAISALLSAVAAIRALPAVITPIEDKMRDRCKEAVWGLYASPVVHPADDDAKDGWQKCCEIAVAAIKGLPVAPPLMPTLEAIAKAICCPDGCVREPQGDCRWKYAEDEATAVMKLFERAAPCGHATDVAAGIAAAIRAMSVAPPFPMPMREPPKHDDVYWVVMPDLPDYCAERKFRLGDGFDARWFARGLCHATRESAEEHGRYLASLSAKTEDGV